MKLQALPDVIDKCRNQMHSHSHSHSHPLNSQAPIGLFDSGVGGLSVYKHLAQQLPAENYLYYADTLHVPYGSRDSEDIKTLTLNAVKWLNQQGCKLIVIACNSASAHALDAARLYYPHLPIVGLVPALKPAVLTTQSGHVAVLATQATLNGTLLNRVIDEVATPNQTTVTKYFDATLVPWVEAGMPATSETAQRLKQQLQHFANDNIDCLVLGCTHYPFFKDFLTQEIVKHQLPIQIVDSGHAIAARVQSLLFERGLLADNQSEAGLQYPATFLHNKVQPLRFYASKYDDNLLGLVQGLLGEKLPINYIV